MQYWEDEHLIIGIERSWSDDQGLSIQGWVISKNGELGDVEIESTGVTKKITSWQSRPEIMKRYPQYLFNKKPGFLVYIPRTVKHQVTIKARNASGEFEKPLEIIGAVPSPIIGKTDQIRVEFHRMVNEGKMRVLEIGSRIVSPGNISMRPMFVGAASYTGFDYYPGTNTDVVGDAHKLSQYFKDQRFDAVCSFVVLEHLAMPWVVAMEISKVLEIGGITFHQTHQAWPLHDYPWDFYRYSEDGLKSLFSPALGFEVIQAGYANPIRMHLDRMVPGQERFSYGVSFGDVAILARKVANLDTSRFRWDTTIEDVLPPGSVYPKSFKKIPPRVITMKGLEYM